MDKPFLSIVIPALNEEKNISDVINNTLNAFSSLNIKGEIVVINDGSKDKTPDIVRELMRSEGRIKIVDHDTPKGIGASFWDGVLNANGEAVCMLPGDGEGDPAEIFRYLALLDSVDMVIPFVYNKEVRALSRNIISRVYLTIMNMTFGTSFNYTNGTIIYRKSILQDIEYRCPNFFFQTDALIKLVKRGYLFAEVPYKLGIRKSGETKAISFSSLYKVAKSYLRLVKDIYFGKKERAKLHKFSKDSVSLKRYT